MSETKLPEIEGAMPPENQQQIGDDPGQQRAPNDFGSQRNSQS